MFMYKKILFSFLMSFLCYGLPTFSLENDSSDSFDQSIDSATEDKTSANEQNNTERTDKQDFLENSCEKCQIPQHLPPIERCSSAPSEKKPLGIFTQAEFLYFQVKEDGLDFAIRNTEESPLTESLLNLDASVIPFDFEFKPGFKLGVGFRIPKHTDWDAFFNWTEINSKCTTKEAYPASVNLGLVPLFWQPGAFSAYDSPVRFGECKADFTFYFNSLDVEIGDSFKICNNLFFRPNAGFKGAIIDQKFIVRSNNGNSVTNISGNTLNILTGTSTFKSSSKGIGPRIGLDTDWKLPRRDLGIFANGSFAFLLTRLNTHYIEHDTAYNVTLDENISDEYKVHEYIWLVKPTLQITAGINWQKCFKEKYLGLKAGYEIQYFWKQNLSRKLIDDQLEGSTYPDKGNLYMQGLVIAAQFEF